jgi:hypothetical protein
MGLDGRMMLRDYGRVQIFMTEDILGFDTFRILRRWPSILICLKYCSARVAVMCGREIK